MNPKELEIPKEWLFPASLEEAIKVQHVLANLVQLEDAFDPIHTYGGMDVSNNIKEPDQIYAAAILLERNFRA